MDRRERTWIHDCECEGQSYLVRITRDGRTIGYVTGNMSMLCDLFADQDYADACGEDGDDLAIWVLSDFGPLPCTRMVVRHEGAGFIQHQVSWRDPLVRGKAARVSESGYTKITEV